MLSENTPSQKINNIVTASEIISKEIDNLLLENKEKIVITLFGLPNSGKSYFLKNLYEKTNLPSGTSFSHLNADMLTFNETIKKSKSQINVLIFYNTPFEPKVSQKLNHTKADISIWIYNALRTRSDLISYYQDFVDFAIENNNSTIK